jgi:hypothetical protein
MDAGADVTTTVCCGVWIQVSEPLSAPNMGMYLYVIVAVVAGGVAAPSFAANVAPLTAVPSIAIA